MKIQTLYINAKPALKAGMADRFFLRLRGMLFRKFGSFEGLVLTPCGSIHTFFMAYPIDAVFFSRYGEVLKICVNVPPGRVVPGAEATFGVLELPAHRAGELGINGSSLIGFGG